MADENTENKETNGVFTHVVDNKPVENEIDKKFNKINSFFNKEYKNFNDLKYNDGDLDVKKCTEPFLMSFKKDEDVILDDDEKEIQESIDEIVKKKHVFLVSDIVYDN